MMYERMLQKILLYISSVKIKFATLLQSNSLMMVQFIFIFSEICFKKMLNSVILFIKNYCAKNPVERRGIILIFYFKNCHIITSHLKSKSGWVALGCPSMGQECGSRPCQRDGKASTPQSASYSHPHVYMSSLWEHKLETIVILMIHRALRISHTCIYTENAKVYD